MAKLERRLTGDFYKVLDQYGWSGYAMPAKDQVYLNNPLGILGEFIVDISGL